MEKINILRNVNIEEGFEWFVFFNEKRFEMIL